MCLFDKMTGVILTSRVVANGGSITVCLEEVNNFIIRRDDSSFDGKV